MLMSETGFVIIPWMRKPRGLSTIFQVEVVKLECALRHVATRATLALERGQRKGGAHLREEMRGCQRYMWGLQVIKRLPGGRGRGFVLGYCARAPADGRWITAHCKRDL